MRKVLKGKRRMVIQHKVSLLLFIFLFSASAIAKDDQLVQDMIDLEQDYIPALFLTGKPAASEAEEAQLLGQSIAKFAVYRQSWEEFSGYYQTYRSSWRNWISYFFHVQSFVDNASALLDTGDRLGAHEVLENIRTSMAELRGRNGFPKFVVDQFTDFHTIMGEIIFIATNAFDENTVEILFELFNEASHAWSKVERNNVDAYAWDLTPAEETFYYSRVEAERAALDSFESALYAGDVSQISGAAKALKPPQAQAYLTLGGVINKP